MFLRVQYHMDFFDKSLLMYVLLLIVIFSLRDHGLRLGFGDSENRMLTGTVPFVVFFSVWKTIALLLDMKTKKN